MPKTKSAPNNCAILRANSPACLNSTTGISISRRPGCSTISKHAGPHMFVLGAKAKFVGSPNADTTRQSTKHHLQPECPAHHLRRPASALWHPDQKVEGDPRQIGGHRFFQRRDRRHPHAICAAVWVLPHHQVPKIGPIIPRDFEFADHRGPRYQGLGLLQPISDHMDATLLFNVYTSGSWGIRSPALQQALPYSGNFDCATTTA